MRVCGDSLYVFAVLHKSSAQYVGHVFQPYFVSCAFMHCKTRPWHGNLPRRCRAPGGLSLRTTGKLSMCVTVQPILLHPRCPVIDAHTMMSPKAVFAFRSVKFSPHITNNHCAHGRVKSIATKKRHKYHAVISSGDSTRGHQKVCNRQMYVRHNTVH